MDKLRSKFREKPRVTAGLAASAVVTVAIIGVFVALVVFRGQVGTDSNQGGISNPVCRLPPCSPSSTPTQEPSKMHPSFRPPSSRNPLNVRASNTPTQSPSTYPSKELSHSTSRPPSKNPSLEPSQTESLRPSSHPSGGPSADPSSIPTGKPSLSPSLTDVKFYPGELNVSENGLRLSAGLTSRILARSGQRVRYVSGRNSTERVHVQPDFGATFVDMRYGNPGGWVYVSNSEDRNRSKGGVGAFTFDAHGNLVDYRMLLKGSTGNCGGGATPWNTWVSCEETNHGVNWQVDPLGERPPEVISLGNDTGGLFESFAYDLVTNDAPQFFVTEDDTNGPLRRWRPDTPNWNDPWSILTGSGRTDYLLIDPSSGTFKWTSDIEDARQNAADNFPNTEGIECDNGVLFFVTKKLRLMYVLNLSLGVYTAQPTSTGGDFNGEPDQIQRVYRTDGELLFFTEDGGTSPGIYARTRLGTDFVTILESSQFINKDQDTTGLTFSPNGKHMYFAIQDAGLIYEVTRLDGLSFNARSLSLKYNVGR